MLTLIAVFTISFILLYSSFRIIDFINKKDDENIEIKKYVKIIISTLTSIAVVCLFLKYDISIYLIKYFILINFLMITGYIDYKTKNIYTFLSIIAGIFAMIFLIIEFKDGNIGNYLLSIALTSIISFVLTKINAIGEGDCEVFIIISMFIGGIAGVFNIFTSFALSGIGAIYLLLTKKVKMKDRTALAHYIAISTTILLIII